MLCLRLHLYANECIVIVVHILSFSTGKLSRNFLSSSKWHRVVCHARRGGLNLPNEGSGQVQIKWVNYFRH